MTDQNGEDTEPETGTADSESAQREAGGTIEETMARAYDRVMADADKSAADYEGGATIEETMAGTYDRLMQDDDGRDGESDDGDHRDDSDNIEAPSHWPQADREVFARLEPPARSFLMRRHREMEADYTRKTQDLAAQRRTAEEFEEAARPYAAMIRAEGATPVTAFRTLLETANLLRTGTPVQKAQALQRTARQFGVDLNANGGGSPMASLSGESGAVAQMAARTAHLEQELRQVQQAQQGAAHANSWHAVEAFAAETGEDGKPLRPHARAVRDEMLGLLASGAAPTIADAYDRAVWANPATRRQMEAEAEERRSREAAKRAGRAAKSARANLPRGADAGRTKEKGRTIEETMGLIYDRIYGGGD